MNEQHLTVLARLEDTLVEEISADERGKCEARHRDGLPSCSGDVAAIASNCGHPDYLACSAIAKYVADMIAGPYRCEGCRQLISGCWSLVVLP